MRRLLPAALLLAWAVLPAEAADHAVDVMDDSFSPPSRTIAPDDTVTWANRGQKLHSVSGDGFNRNLLPGGTFDWTFPTAGTFAYRCTFHESSGMRGTIVVQAATTAALDETTTTSTTVAGSAAPDDDSDPSNAGPAAVAALLLAAVSGAAALAVKRGL